MKRSLLISAVLVLVSPVLVWAQTSDTSIAVSRLKSTPFTVGPLRITFSYLKGRALIADASGSIGFRASVKIEVENTSDDFAAFDPRGLSIVDKNDDQADVLGLDPAKDTLIFPAETRLAPVIAKSTTAT